MHMSLAYSSVLHYGRHLCVHIRNMVLGLEALALVIHVSEVPVNQFL